MTNEEKINILRTTVTMAYLDGDTRRELLEFIEEFDGKEIIRKPIERILTILKRKEVLEDVAPTDDVLTKGYVLGIKKAIKVIEEEGGEDE